MMKSIKQYMNKFYCAINIGICTGVLATGGLALFPTIQVQASSDTSIQSLAIELETQFWTAVQNRDSHYLDITIIPIFQGIGLNVGDNLGVSTREDEITNLLNSMMSGFTLENIVATKHHHTLVVTYTLLPVNSVNLPDGPIVSIWEKFDGHWKLISQNFCGSFIG